MTFERISETPVYQQTPPSPPQRSKLVSSCMNSHRRYLSHSQKHLNTELRRQRELHNNVEEMTDRKRFTNVSSNAEMDNYNQSNTSDQRPLKKKIYKSKVFLIAVSFSVILLAVMTVSFIIHYMTNVGGSYNESLMGEAEKYIMDLPNEQQKWYKRGILELEKALNRKQIKKRAKNLILFVGDGMGPNTVTAARIMGFSEEGLMSWEEFPNMGLLKTYCANKQVPDSFSTATALFSGVKINYETGGVDSSVKLGNCLSSLDAKHHVNTILKWAQDDGMLTGFVTNTRVTHATPAALYAHVPDRRWECEQKMPPSALKNGCKDIARQLIEDDIGQNINIIMGGGRQMLVSNVTGSFHDPIDTWAGRSKDGRNLIQKWSDIKSSRSQPHIVVENSKDLLDISSSEVDYILGIFANGHMKYEFERDTSPVGMPSLKEMVLKALEFFKTKDQRFLLVVEGGMIDQAHHRGTAKKALGEVLALNEAVNATFRIFGKQLDDTLVIVTADHSHTLTINGYPDIGSDIMGVAGKSKTEGTHYTTLTYGTTYKGFQPDEKGLRKDPTQVDTKDWEYRQQGAINTDENYHGGSDVTIHSVGPMSHLFHGVHEQSYVAHAIAYALRIGRFRDSSIEESIANKY